MPKVKTKSTAKKRFKKTKTGLIKRSKAYRRHLLSKKSAKRKRNLRQATYVCAADMPSIKKLIARARS